MPARFISFEGGEGVGKSTQVKRLAARLNTRGIGAVTTREPGGTARAEEVRHFILSGRGKAWGPGAEAILFAAARADHMQNLIAPSLQAGKWVLSDRFHDSTRAYQGLTSGSDPRLITALETLALNGREPDITFILDMDPALAFERVKARGVETALAATGDRFEQEDLDWHQRLRAAFLAISEANPRRCVVLPAGQGADALEQEIWDVLVRRFDDLRDAT